MAAEEVYIARLGAWLARALAEVGTFAVDLDTEGLGLQMPDAIVADNNVKTAGKMLGDTGDTLREAADKLDAAAISGDEGQLGAAFATLVDGLFRFLDALKKLVDGIDTKSASLPEPGRSAVKNFCELMVRKAFDYLAITILEQQRPRLAFLLKLLGLIDWRVIELSGAPNEPRYIRKDIKFERIKDFFNDPIGHFANVYGWGTPDFDPADIMSSVLAFYHEEASIKFGKVGGNAFLKRGPFTWSRDSSVAPPGLMLDVSAEVKHSFDQRVEFSPKWGMDFKSTLGLGGGAIFRLKPPFEFSVEPKAGTASGEVSFIVNRNAAARGFSIVGGNDLIRLTAENTGIGAELTVGASTSGRVTIEPGVSAELKGLTLSLGSAGSDNFLASLLANADIKGVFDIGLKWTLDKGLVITGAGGLEIAIPMHQSLGIATFDTLYIILKLRDDGSLPLETSAGIQGQLGPLSASVDRIGAETKLSFPPHGGNAGPLQIDLSFKPPNGVGLSLDAGVVSGGGYLYFDFDREEYAGVLDLSISEIVTVKAIGLITTKMPDGSKGFSLLIIITAEFGTGIQLGFGFTLIGLGGLLGLNRTMNLQPLMEGVRTGAINSIMFPQNPVANAPKIISDLRTIFPPYEGKFLIGPMAKLGWGTPTLVSVALGVIIEIPGNIAILGVLKIALPAEDAALIVLQVNFAGAIEFDKSRLYFFAALFESRVLFLTLEGEMGLLVAWGDDANFVVSAGGFHPRFNPPPLPFPSPRRMAISILNTDIARIRTETYFAVTSNTVQFGSNTEIMFDVDVARVDGHLGFDALFQFSPFHFIIEVSASVSLKVFGVGLFSISLQFALEGPTPWRAHGTGTLSLFFFDVSADFDITWGESKDTTLPPIAVIPLLKGEFDKLDNWRAQLPSANNLLVSLRKLDETESTQVLHPLGALRVSQRAVPLDLKIDKVGNQKPSDANQFKLTATAGLVKANDADEQFAKAQFLSMSDADKLSQRAFDPMHGGLLLASGAQQLGSTKMGKRKVRYEEIIIDSNYKRFHRRFRAFTEAFFSHFLIGGAVSKSVLSQNYRKLLDPFEEKVAVKEGGFTVAHTEDNKPYSVSSTYFASEAMANQFLQSQLVANPDLHDALHVIPQYEARL